VSRVLRSVLAVALALNLASTRSATQPIADAQHRPGASIRYLVEQPVHMGRALPARFAPAQRAILEKLNRADDMHLGRLDALVIPAVWHDDELLYSPFALSYPAASHLPKWLVVDQPAQAFAAYERGRLVRWGPVSSGRLAHPTPSGIFHLNWRSRGRHSTVNPAWYMEWYFNFHNTRGLALHKYALPGYPASHACIRLLERDAIWIYEWGEGWTLDWRGHVAERGTPLLILGQYDFHGPPPWRCLERLALGIDLPDSRVVRSTSGTGVSAAGLRMGRLGPTSLDCASRRRAPRPSLDLSSSGARRAPWPRRVHTAPRHHER
jgi:lipoprotein-anchoring transpeptidase ErfK/SrfK